MASFSTFTDPMTASTQNTGLWTGNFGTLSWSPNGFTISNPAAYTGYGGMDSIAAYDLTGTSVYCSMAGAGNQALASLEVTPYKLIKDATNNVFWYINTNTLYAFKTVAGTQTQITAAAYNATNHKWFRVSESGGTLTWATSPDGITWTTFGTPAANPFAITALSVEPTLGTYSSEASSTSAKWNSFSTPVATVTANNNNLLLMGVG